jgi:cysteinyl-tRNA synthetase
MKIFNTMSGKKEDFIPIIPNKVSMYHCGPTVYDTAHIGNLRTFVMNDIVRRVFEYSGFTVDQAMNITDIDDKTLRKASEEGLPLKEISERYEKLFLEDMKSLRILTPHHTLRATENIEEMITLISILIEKGVAYPSSDGIYLSIGMVKNYGALARLKLDGHTEARVGTDEYEKENPRDFALWKFGDGENTWPALFGRGRPGWHIECSAMAIKALGETFDIHTGGTDLIFPHHVNEIAQSETATGKPFAKYWIHGGFMNIDDAKMAKSKGNFFKLQDLEDESISPLSFRYWLMTSHYRSPVNFTFDAVRASQNAFIKLVGHVMEWGEVGGVDEKYKKKFLELIQDDFDMPGAIALVWELVKDKEISNSVKKATVIDFDRVLGLGLSDLKPLPKENVEIPEEITALAEVRSEARKAKDWQKADAVRVEIEERGYEVIDTEGSPDFIVKER